LPKPVDTGLHAVLDCAIIPLPAVPLYLCCSFSMPKWSGGLFWLTYVIYFVFALWQEVSCLIWPPACGVPKA